MEATLNFLDYALIALFFSITFFIGIKARESSGKNTESFFLSGRSMPWWLLGFSMVATTFSTDTPNFVTNIVRLNGVSSNWEWWAFLLTGMLTVFVYARLWRKSNVTTDMEFYSLRYGGKPASFLRSFRAVYLGVAFNVLAMAGVILAAIKIGQVLLGLSPWQTVGLASFITVIFSAIGGLKGVIYTDFFLFFVAIIGSIAVAYYSVKLPEVGGLDNLLSHDLVKDKLSILPDFSDNDILITLWIIPLAVQWWGAWFPGSEPGGGGYIAQRMLAAKNENHAIKATLFFNILNYALRPWPWILVALASLIVFPDLESIKRAFPDISENKLGHDLAYAAMLSKMPSGLLGLILASLIAAFMSTISTHLNWGASYIVNDYYRFKINPEASEKELVNVGRIATVILMVISTFIALSMQDAYEVFRFIIMFGAGTGLIFILRWFWWRINAWSEISAMLASGFISILFQINAIDNKLFGYTLSSGVFVSGILPHWSKFPLVVLFTTIVWLLVTFLTSAEDNKTLKKFYIQTQPGNFGWKPILNELKKNGVRTIENKNKKSIAFGILTTFVGCILGYACLFATGYWIYSYYDKVIYLSVIIIVCLLYLVRIFKSAKI